MNGRLIGMKDQHSVKHKLQTASHVLENQELINIRFLPLDEAIASRAVFVIVSGTGGNSFAAS